MIKSELISRLAKKQPDILEKEITQGTNLILEYLSETLASGGRIEIRTFGSISLHYRRAHNAHNPKTGEKVQTPAKYIPHFKPGKVLRSRVDNSRHHTAILDDTPDTDSDDNS